MLVGMSARKHKKHHKHRHKRHKDSESVGDGGVEDPPQLPTIKLKLKIGTETMGTKRWGQNRHPYHISTISTSSDTVGCLKMHTSSRLAS